MKISGTKIIYYLLTFQKSKIPQYLLEVANNWVVNVLPEATRQKVSDALYAANAILSALKRYEWLCPEKWRTAYGLTVQAFADVVEALVDLQIDVAEVEKVAAAFKIAFAEWCAD